MENMEHAFHHWLKRQTATTPDFVQIGIGDDGAVLGPSDHAWVITTDTIAEGTHFDLEQHELKLVGRKSLAVNLSDLAAMGSRPMAATVNFLLPQHFQLEHAQELFSGIATLAAEFEIAIVGGDTNRWPGPLVVGATAFGRRNPTQTGWTIGGARPGDAILVSGCFGGSLLGRHLSFTPRVQLANHLAQHYTVHAATDVSDSLSLDLALLARSSKFGVDLDLTKIPISNSIGDNPALDQQQRLNHALQDGEDFELILSMPQSELTRVLADPKIDEPLSLIGWVTDQHQQLRAKDAQGNRIEIQPQGYIH